MKRSTVRAYRRARFVVVCFFAMSSLFLVGISKQWAAGKVTADTVAIKSTHADFKDNLTPRSPAAATGNFTLNKYIYPGNTTFTNLSPLATTASPISSWSIGVPILYVITIGNSNPAQTSLVNITLRDGLSPSTLDPNFVILKVSCDAFSGAVCPFPTNVPPPGTTLPLIVPNIQIKVGTEVVFRIEGYYKTQGTFQNTFSVFETGKQATTEEQGPPKNVQITNNWSVIDLKLSKTSSTTSTSLSATVPATIHYKLTLTGDSSQDFYPGNLLRIQDTIIASHPPLPSYSIPISTLTSFICSSVNGSTCPAAPLPLNPSPSSFSGTNAYAYTYLDWPASSPAVIKKGDIITMEFDLDVKTAANCGSSSITIQNQASITAVNPLSYSDSNNGNNYNTPTTQNSFTTGLLACPPAAGPPGTITKTRVCPTSGCPTVNWGDTVTYQIVVKNNLATAQDFQVVDYVSKPAITVPLRATLDPNSTPSDVHCSPATILCTTAPPTTVPAVNLITDGQYYSLFTTNFTLQPNGSADDSVTLTFNVKLDKLADCQTDPGNFFDNIANLYRVSSSGVNYLAQTPAVRVKLPELSPCNLKVTKILNQPTNGVTFGQPVSYTITYENLDSQPITVRTLRDALNIRDTLNSNPYGNIPITNLTASCTSATGVSPMPSYQLFHTQIFPSSPAWAGTTVIHETSAATGITFPANSKLQCTVSFTPHEPSATDNYCKGAGRPEIVNNAYMDISAIQTNVAPSAPYFAQATAPLPLCRKVAVLKTIGGGVTSTGPNGLLTFQIKVTNYGNDPVSNFLLNDPLPTGFTDSGPITCTPTTACASAVFSGTSPRVLNATFNPIPASPNNTVTFTFNVNASPAGGTSQNTATGSFGSGLPGTNFYFEGDPAVLLVNSAQVQVLTPTLIKSFQPNSIAVNGSAVLTFTITNQTSDPAQTAISFTDLLPSGVTVTSAPSTACGGTVSVSGGNTVSLSNGSLVQGQHQCKFAVNVKASSCGAFVNDQTNFSHVSNLDVTNARDTLTVTGCPPPTESCPVKTNEISCKADGTGGYLYSFTVTNHTGHVVTDILLTPPANSNITLSPQQFPLLPSGLADGQSLTLQVTINGGQPNQSACFDVTLMTKDGKCCTTRVCPVLPDCCGIVRDENIECNRDGTYTYTLSVVNTGVNTIEHVYLYPPDRVTMTPNYFQVSLKPGATFTTKVIIKGAKPGDKLCFGISLHSANMESCCRGEHCIVLPECPVPVVR